MRFGGDGETYGVNVSDQAAPFSCRTGMPLLRDSIHAVGVDVANAGEVRLSFTSQRGVNARVLLSEMSDANDCGA